MCSWEPPFDVNVAAELGKNRCIQRLAEFSGIADRGIENVDKNGLGRDGAPVALPPGSDDMLERAFATGVGQISPIGQLSSASGNSV